MSEQKDMLADAVTRLFRDAGSAAADAEKAGWQQALWAQVEELGLRLVLVPEAADGVGGDWEDAYVVLHAAGLHAIPLPIGESMLAARLAADAGLELPPGAATIAVDVDGGPVDTTDGIRFTGTLSRVPWGRNVETIATVFLREGRPPQVGLLARAEATSVFEATNTAGEPRDTLEFKNATITVGSAESPEAAALFDYAALIRVAQIVGALEGALHRSIDYARERKQFGRAIGQFQAVQQQLALFGGDALAAACAARAASRAATRLGVDAGFAIASAKLRANLAIGLATSTAHQVHAAIGFTYEYALRHHTQRLWAWRSEFGNDRYWSERLGAAVAARGADRFWSDMTALDDRANAAA